MPWLRVMPTSADCELREATPVPPVSADLTCLPWPEVGLAYVLSVL